MEQKDIRMAASELRREKYIVKLTKTERTHLWELLNKGKSPAKRLLKARILLKADESELGENWSDGQIIKALDTNAAMLADRGQTSAARWFGGCVANSSKKAWRLC
jgi:hypothetical protein